MANNYTISGNTEIFNPATGQYDGLYQQTELIGDIVVAGNIANWTPAGINDSAILTITPSAGYVISASDFSVTNLSSFVGIIAIDNGVTFTNTSVADTLQNTVIVKVNLDPAFQLTGGVTDTISLDIDGSAALWAPAAMPANVSVISEAMSTIIGSDTNSNANATVTITPNTGFSRDISVSGTTTEIAVGGQATPNAPVVMATLAMPADSGYYFQNQPYLAYANMPSSVLRLVPSTITRDSNNRITTYNFKVVYKNNVATKANSGAKAFIKYKTTKIPTITTNEIKNLIHGSSQVSVGEIRPIKVYGDPGAEFDLTVTKAFNGVSIIDTNIANTTVVNPIYGSIRGINKKLASRGKRSGTAVYTLNQEFPVNKGYTTTVDGTRDSDTMVINGDTGFVTKNNNIRKGDQLIYNDVDTGAIVTVLSITNATTVVLSEAVDMDDTDSVRFIRPESYHINIYPKAGSTLKSTMPTVVPHYTLNQYKNPRLTLTTSETDGSYTGPTNVYQHTGRPNAYPNQLEHISSIPKTFSVKWICTGHTFSAVATSGIPIWSSTEALDASSSTASFWTNSVPADNGGTHIEIFNIAVTGIGTTTFTLTADVLIKKWGTQDVTMNLDLDKIIT